MTQTDGPIKNLIQVAMKWENRKDVKFREVGKHDVLKFEPSGHICRADGKRHEIDMRALLAAYEIICDHPFTSWSKLSEAETGKRLCVSCDRVIDLIPKDPLPSVPEKISQAAPKLTKQEQEKEETLARDYGKRTLFIEPGLA